MEQKVKAAAKAPRQLDKQDLLKLYRLMYRARQLDSLIERWQRMGRSHFYIGAAGHEALLAGVALHLKPGVDWIVTHYRDLCVALASGITPRDVLAAAVGSTEEPGSRGRQLPYHFGKRSARVITGSSPVGTQFLTGVGMGYASLFYSEIEAWKDRRDLWHPDELVYVGSGEGTTSEGEFWEALNFAANPVHPCPVLFVIEDNQWAISTHVHESTAGGSLSDLLTGFRDQGLIWLGKVDGLDPIKSAALAREATEFIRRERRPAVLHGLVMRYRGHSCEDDERLYRSAEEIAAKQKTDPLATYPRFLLEEGIAGESELAPIRDEIDREIEQAREEIEHQLATHSVPYPPAGSALQHLYSESVTPTSPSFQKAAHPEGEPLTLIKAINRCLHSEFARDPRLFTHGEDVADVSILEDIDRVSGKGGVFGGRTGGITANLQRAFGRRRCFNSPLAEGCIVGIANGAALRGLKPVPEVQFDDYFWPAYQHFRAETATMRWRSAGLWTAPLVIRVPSQGYTGGIGAIWHSQSNEANYVVPGVWVVMPSTPSDAVGLLRTALRSDDPVVFLEPKVLYRRTDIAEPYPGDDYTIPFGKARTVWDGDDVTCVTWGIPVHMLATIVKRLHGEGIGVHLLDLRSLQPWDTEAVSASLERTGRLLVVHGASRTMGFGAEIVSWVTQHCFDSLLAPPTILGALDCPVGYGSLERQILPQEEDMEKAIRDLLRYD
jgi:2-oxoisovalerate dehydrogenase E1 component